MEKITKRDIINLIILILLFIFIIIFITKFKFIYGSTTDWQQQHWVFPEYFRNLFYDTHNIFPSFAFNIGGGQNIFNFSYYGLFSPIVLLSYFLPFISMMDYIIISSIFLLIASTILFYVWMKKNGFNSSICFLSSLLFLCSGPLIFQSHRHIMFINYLPFLILGLIGVDVFFKKKKSLLLIVSTFLMIMTSYFFSVSGIMVIIIYGIYKYLKLNPNEKFKQLFLSMLKIMIPIILGVCLAGLLLLPTFYSLIAGRNDSSSANSLLDISLLFPNFTFKNLFYNAYSLGTISISLFALLWGLFSKKKERIVLAIIILSIIILPVFIYLLNGTLYIRAKVLIPFIPLLCLISAEYLNDLHEKTRGNKRLILILISFVIIIIINDNHLFKLTLAIDAAVTFLAIIAYIKFNKKILLYLPIVIISLSCCLIVNSYDKLILISEQEKNTTGISEVLEKVKNSDKDFYRFSNEVGLLNNVNRIFTTDYYQTSLYSSIYNQDYKTLYFDIFNNELSYRNFLNTGATKNVLFNIYMGNKYIITDGVPQIGYSLVATEGSTSVYKNDDAFPLGYVTNKIMGEKEFDKLSYPSNSEALLEYCVTDSESNDVFKSDVETYPNDNLILDNYKNLNLENTDGFYNIAANSNANMNLNLVEPLNNKILFIRFKMNIQSSNEDTYIIINGVKNKLTSKTGSYPNNNYVFDYAISSNEQIDKLDIYFNKGEYIISDIELHTIDYSTIKNIKNTLDCFNLDMSKTSGDIISGNINVTDDGIFVLNIPYDRGFTIKVDGKVVEYQKVNKAFIGFDVKKGVREITINYKAPLFTQGIVLSVIGLVFSIIFLLIENKKRRVL